MKTAKMLTMLVLALGVMVWQAEVSKAGEPMGTAFTYQGRLLDANDVANGLYDFEFELYDAPSDGNQLGSTIDINDLDVIDGYFTVVLDFNEPNAFNGEARWLDIGVRPGELSDPCEYTILEPRQELTPTPYAIYAARAGVDVPFSLTGSVGYPGAVFSVTNTGSGYGLYGEATGSSGRGVYGIASNTGSAYNYGGHFRAEGSSGRGIYGEATNSGTTTNYGGYFTAAGSLGRGVLGEASGSDGKGVYGYASGSNGRAVYGYASNSGAVTNYGGYFKALGDFGRGVYGEASGTQGRGVYGKASGTGTLANYGGWFEAAGPQSSAGVYGVATASGDLLNVGGAFEARGDSGRGVTGQATALGPVENIGGAFTAYGDSGRGVYGQGWASGDVQNYGGYFEASGRLGTGVFGQTSGGSGRGVYGLAWGEQGTGVYGAVVADSSKAVAIYGYTHAELTPNAYAGYFEGKVDITRKLTVGDNAYISGNLAIGSTNTTKKLAVRGNILVESVGTGDAVVELGEGLDYAEGFDVTEERDIEPGTVLVIDADNPGKLTVSRSAYDSRVAGIVAGGKGLGSGVRLGVSQFDQDVALAGRVYCNVDATETSVEPGDLLTTSGAPGYAMKATDYIRAQGAILGKAMEKLEQGKKGQILVLVTLQ